MMKKFLFTLFLISIFSSSIFSQAPTCASADPFCTGTTYNFPAGVGSGNAETGPNYGCLGSQPNPVWYYMRVATPGNIEVYIHSNTGSNDLDFACWGPFNDIQSACGNLTGGTGGTNHHSPGPGGGYPNGNMIDCSYDPSYEEWCYVPNAQVGQWYMLMITNYSNSACNIIFNQTGGTGTTDCSILAPPINNNGPLCVGDTLKLTVNNPTAGATYNWTGPNGWTSNDMNPIILNVTTANAGTYNLTITVGGVTSDPVSTTVVINPLPIVTVVSSPDTICSGTSSTITASGATTYLWSGGTTGTANPQTVSPTTTTTYTVVGTSNNCSASAETFVYVYETPIVNATASSNEICYGDQVVLTAAGADNYYWTGVSAGATSNPVVLTPNTTYTYNVTGSSNGCTGTASLTVTVNPVPTSDFTAVPPSCSDIYSYITYTGSASTNATYSWNFDGGTVASGSGQGPYQVTWPTFTNHNITLQVTENNCTSSVTTHQIASNPQLNVSSTYLNETCTGSCNGSITGSASGGTAPYTYNWSNSSIHSELLPNLCAGYYYVTVTDVNGCSGSTTAIIGTSYPINVNCIAAPNPGVAPAQISFNTTGSGAVSYSWDFGDGSTSTQIPVFTHIFQSAGEYQVTLIASTGSPYNCEAYDTITIIVYEPSHVNFPNVFTPNTDGVNDDFYVESIGLNTEQMKIYNRWGEKVAGWDVIGGRWDGRDTNGVPCAEGIYFFILNAAGFDTKIYTLQGSITLLR